MPEGPFGFPRLTSLGPLVDDNRIQPIHSLIEGNYNNMALDKRQPLTYESTMEAIYAEERHSDTLMNINENYIEWHYHKMSIQQLLDGNSFANHLLYLLSAFEKEYPNMMDEDTDVEEFISVIRDQLDKYHGDDDSIFELVDISSVANVYRNYEESGEEYVLDEVSEKIGSDIHTVLEINEDIRHTKDYWPPTVEKDADEDTAMGFGTIDGSHRLVSLSQILGERGEIYVWEWSNEEEFVFEVS